MSSFCSFFLGELNALINESREPVQVEEVLDKKGQPIKKDDKKAAKKGGKDDLSAYESPLGASVGGVESLHILLDKNLFVLPWEKLPVFSQIPAVSRDFSLQYLAKKYQSIGFKAELNNSSGISKTGIRHVSYNFKKAEFLDSQPIFTKNAGVLKVDGISSS